MKNDQYHIARTHELTARIKRTVCDYVFDGRDEDDEVTSEDTATIMTALVSCTVGAARSASVPPEVLITRFLAVVQRTWPDEINVARIERDKHGKMPGIKINGDEIEC